MADFIVQIQVLSPPGGVQDAMHEALVSAGLTTLVPGENGIVYRLLPNTYRYTSDISAINVRDYIHSLLDPIYSKYWILVSEFRKIAWKMDKARE